jgi:hypothetical protein
MTTISMLRLFLSLGVAISAITGCATSHYAGLARGAGAEPATDLAVEPVTTQVPRTRVTEVRDSNGALVGTEETVLGYREVVSGFALKRGGAAIDEQDFYELARDRDGLDAVARARARGMAMNRTGLALIVASTVAAIAVPIAAGRGTAPYAVGQWFVAFPIGLGLTLFGQRPFDDKVLPVGRAFSALGQSPEPWAARLD